jgi:hypothetical protein
MVEFPEVQGCSLSFHKIHTVKLLIVTLDSVKNAFKMPSKSQYFIKIYMKNIICSNSFTAKGEMTIIWCNQTLRRSKT